MNNLPTYEELSDDQVATMIAEEMGWVCKEEIKMMSASCYWYDGDRMKFFAPMISQPNYGLALPIYGYWNPRYSLDQCWIFEEWILKLPPRKGYSLYCQKLILEVGDIAPTIHATANQRCKAFLLTTGKVR